MHDAGVVVYHQILCGVVFEEVVVSAACKIVCIDYLNFH